MHFDRRPSIFNSLLVALLLAVLGGAERAAAQTCQSSDITSNGSVDSEDLVVLLGSWGTNNADADINGDGLVEGADLNLVLASWGTCNPVFPLWADPVPNGNYPPADLPISNNLLTAIKKTGLAWKVTDRVTGIEMVLIPPVDTFTMGCGDHPGFNQQCNSDENPPHQVELPYPFYLSTTEVTQAQWLARMEANPSHFHLTSPQVNSQELVLKRPVEMVSWNLVQNFLNNVNNASGSQTFPHMRLPTEAEWEYAYRAGTILAYHGFTTSQYPTQYLSGTDDNGFLGYIAWYSGNSDKQTRPVGDQACNGFGLHDMSGNVWEWVNDWYLDTYYQTSTPWVNPKGPPTGQNRVLRGGSWYDGPNNCRASRRASDTPDYAGSDIGFRVARDPFKTSIPSWATLIEEKPDPSVVTDQTLRDAIIATGWAWRVKDTATQIEMMLIPPETFRMGCSLPPVSGQTSCQPLALCPQEEGGLNGHQVQITRPFYLGRTEVTQAQFYNFGGINPSHFNIPDANGDFTRPVESLNVLDPWLLGTGMRLPTEAEWEYAYRAGTTTAYHGYSGQPDGADNDTELKSIAWFSGNSDSRTRPVGSGACNGFGLYDMSGNVWEWVNDWYDPSYYASSSPVNPQGPSASTVIAPSGKGEKTIRGGSYNSCGIYCRASSRAGNSNLTQYEAVGDLGFRVARDPVDPKSPTWASAWAGPSFDSRLQPDPEVVTDPNLRFAIRETGYAWKVTDNATQIEMVLIPPGTFQMGCDPTLGIACKSDEIPIHQVTLTDEFYLGTTEVTQAQWQARMGSNPSSFQSASAEVPQAQVPQRPVESVSWNLVQTFLSHSPGMRLPTEAEWEYAYRAGTTTLFHGFTTSSYPTQYLSGTNNLSLLGNIAWFQSNANYQTLPVGGQACNGFGLHDMSGNVNEWVNDGYDPSYYSTGPSVNPPGPSSPFARVLRGGGWESQSGACRASERSHLTPDGSNYVIGVRVAKNPIPTP